MGVKYIPDNKTLEKIKDMANDGCTITQISALVGRERGTIKRVLNDYKIKIKPTSTNRKGRKYEWRRDRVAKLKELYASDQYSLDDIAEYFETSKSTVLKYAKIIGLKKVPAKFFKEKDLNFIKENAGKMTLSDMAKHLGTKDDWTIGKHLAKMGIAVRRGKKFLKPESEKFKNDIGNPAYSNSALGRMYNVSAGVIGKWRKEEFGSYKRMVDTFLCKSTAEMDFEDILTDLHLSFIYEQHIGKWKVDYDLGFNLLVEIQGSHWHDEVEKTIEKDKRKRKSLSNMGYRLIEIWDYELKDKEKVKEKLLTPLKECIDIYFKEVS